LHSNGKHTFCAGANAAALAIREAKIAVFMVNQSGINLDKTNKTKEKKAKSWLISDV
jgi:hypothetical protein